MNYNEAIEYIHSIPKFNRILGNDLLNILLDKIGRPDNKLKFIHIGGTNGKGSISTMTAEILKRAGYKVGLFTSPYLEYFNAVSYTHLDVYKRQHKIPEKGENSILHKVEE